MPVPGWRLQFVGGKEQFREGSGRCVSKIASQNTVNGGGQNGAMILQTRSKNQVGRYSV